MLEQAAAEIYDQVRTADDDGNAIAPKDTLPRLNAHAIELFGTNLAALRWRAD